MAAVMQLGAAMDRTAFRRLDDSLQAADEALWLWAKHKRADRPPNGWYTESNHERAIRGPRSTAPSELPPEFVTIDAAVAKCTGLEQKVLYIRFVRYPDATKDFQRKRLNMSEGKWDRTLRAARSCVAAHL